MKNGGDDMNTYEDLEGYDNTYENEPMDNAFASRIDGYYNSCLRLYNKSTNEKAD